MINEHKKGVRAMKYTTKPRNFVAKNAVSTGSGAHRDKKKEQKRGEEKHRKKAMDMAEGVSGGIAGGIAGGVLTKSPRGAVSGYEVGDKVQQLFSKESADGGGEYNDEEDMVQNNLHTIIRCAEHLSEILEKDENMAEWAQEKIAIAKSMVVTILDYVASEHERGNVYHTDEENLSESDWYYFRLKTMLESKLK